MARIWSCGFELQSVADGVELDNNYGDSINTALKHAGAASLRCNSSIVASDAAGMDTIVAPATTHFFARWYIYIAALPNSASVAAYCDILSGATNVLSVQISYNGATYNAITYWNAFAVSSASGFTVTPNAWHYIEVEYDSTPADGAEVLKVRLDGVQVVSETGVTFTTKTANAMAVGIFNGTAGTITTHDVYWDDLAWNDTSGSVQNSFPGAGSIVHAIATTAGDNNSWQTSAGGAGSATNVAAVDETIPDDATTYLKRIATTVKIDDYNVPDIAALGIGASDTITLVAVGVRGGAIAATVSTDRDILLRLKSAASGTTVKSAVSTNRLNVNGWVTHTTVAPKTYQLTSYLDPTTGVAWTPSGTNSINNMQIGMENQTSVVTEVRVTTVWALIEYVPFVGAPSDPIKRYALMVGQSVHRSNSY